MDIKKIFASISGQLLEDFVISAELSHNGNVGDYREEALREFLVEGKLPLKYGVGGGEIINFNQQVSCQSDFVIYDQLKSVPFVYKKTVQAYAIEHVYGIIEVKSKLSKGKLLEGLENIKSVKKLVPNDFIDKTMGLMRTTEKRPKPFGCIFAYHVADNSLESLAKNLSEWESTQSPSHWPNLIVVLHEGIIFHTNANNERQIHSSEFDRNSTVRFLKYGKDSLLYFYSWLLDLCNNINLPNFEISKYFDFQSYGGVQVSNHIFVKEELDGTKKDFRLTEKFLATVVVVSLLRGGVDYGMLITAKYGTIIGTQADITSRNTFFYNPSELTLPNTVAELNELYKNRKLPGITPYWLPYRDVVINSQVFRIPLAYITDEHLEPHSF
ncbi:DUF6602 domain-containing protein [Dyadobacter sp. MSC1_007]|jgi:hypothetical protein|uniref:DUF6602 domain-containing protein n=1 Tax=Dyadobacter sp. MSC1_007 TaxID=2909264 RepID=UPI002030285D|nr:DUF6602 domain-containing protein [Dyadobacter sp. MSC1_007]